MSLFIGNICKDAEIKDIEKSLNKYGKCYFNYKGKYGFAEFDRVNRIP